MSFLIGFRERLRAVWCRSEDEREMDEEIRFHLEMEAERNLALGMSPEEARRRAVIALGGVEATREATREERRVPLLEDLWRDLRYARRALGRSPGYSLTIVLTLALGIGSSVAIHTAVRDLVTHAVPFGDADRLISLELSGERGVGLNPRYEDFRAWEAAADPVVVLGGYTFGSRTLGDGSRTTYARGIRVTSGFFPALGVRPLLGRTLGPGDEDQESGPVAVLGHRVWAGALGADSAIVGKPVLVDGRPHTVVGVLPAGLEFPAGSDLWIPLAPDASEAASTFVSPIGRLRPAATPEDARTALEAIQGGLDAERPPEERASRVSILPLLGRWAESALQAILLLQIAVVSLLLIGMASASGLILTRGLERQHEIAIRASLGASRWRIVRQLFTEVAVLAFAAGALSLVVAHLTIAALRLGPAERFARDNLLGWERLGLDGAALTCAFILSAVVALLCGLLPAIRSARGDLTRRIGGGTRTATTGRAGGRAVRLLLSGEVALALVLLITGGLLAGSVVQLLRLDPGHRVDDVLTIRWTLPADRYADDRAVTSFQQPLLDRLRAMPGVHAASIVSNLPTTRFGPGVRRRYRLAGSGPAAEPESASWRAVGPDYFRAMGVPLQGGRRFTAYDGPGSRPAVMISEALAQRHWSGGSAALGGELTIDDQIWTVVGVVGNVRNGERSIDETIYAPQRQAPTSAGFAVVRLRGEAPGMALRIRDEIWSLDPDVAVGETQTMRRILRDNSANGRTLALLAGIFAVIALVVTVISLYGLVSHAVARQRREIGIRLVLGARPRQIVVSAMGQGMLWVGLGVAVGLPLAGGVARLAGSMLYGFAPVEAAIFVLAAAGFIVLTAVASYIPARRAAGTNPAITLREE